MLGIGLILHISRPTYIRSLGFVAVGRWWVSWDGVKHYIQAHLSCIRHKALKYYATFKFFFSFFLSSRFDTKIGFLSPNLVHFMSFETNQPQTYMGVKFWCWTEEMYSRIRQSPPPPRISWLRVPGIFVTRIHHGWTWFHKNKFPTRSRAYSFRVDYMLC